MTCFLSQRRGLTMGRGKSQTLRQLIAERHTRKVDAFAISFPHDSAMISRVRACVPVSIPLFTKIRRGILSCGILGCSSSNTFLERADLFNNAVCICHLKLTLAPALALRIVPHPALSAAPHLEALGLSPRSFQGTHDLSNTFHSYALC